MTIAGIIIGMVIGCALYDGVKFVIKRAHRKWKERHPWQKGWR